MRIDIVKASKECDTEQERFAFQRGAKYVIDNISEACSDTEVLKQIYKVMDLNAYESRGFKFAIDYIKKKLGC